jgi:hypothetical protein
MSSGPEYHNPDRGPGDTEILDTGYPPPRRHTHLAGLLAVALVALVGGAGVAYAVTNPSNKVVTDFAASGHAQTPVASPSPSAPPWKGGRPGGFGRFGGPGPFGALGGFGGFGLGGVGGVVHGEFTEPKQGGGYQTVEVQRGTVTAVSSSSITIKSADGFSATYAVSSSTEVNAKAAGIGTVKVGDTVGLTATVSNGKATAASIVDMTAIKSSRGAFGFPAGPPAGSQN